MSGPVSSLAQVPLSDVLPSSCVDAEPELRRLAGDLESHPAAAGRIRWHWYPEHKTPPGTSRAGVCLIVCDAAITVFDQDHDSLELTLTVGWCPELTVSAAVEVACWCSSDHNIHEVRGSSRPATNGAALVNGFAAGAAMLTRVLDSGQFDPRRWRVEAGLPDAAPKAQ
ncbi:hypothetical protein KOI35_17075 [Actinoplanes bogorensis]|uniref:Uncharacterized protein n=1 Tax=Paractinoplanes bogorensis TaxID=1610840 RepID=A0ABS5YP40_9ACTN|nr:hypothetical protein [Actinoplanes bogorensis]MBU2665218.1 hypothetical protein [Actinoplanes bogorensis]